MLDSYLIQITAEILKVRPMQDGAPLVDKILDTRRAEGHRQVDGHRGAGRGHAAHAHRRGRVRPLPLGHEGRARARVLRAHGAVQPKYTRAISRQFIDALEQALYAAKIISYAQGYMLMRAAAKTYSWNLNYGGIALMWRGGCIIRSVFLGKIKEAYDRDPEPGKPAAGSSTSPRRCCACQAGPAHGMRRRRC